MIASGALVVVLSFAGCDKQNPNVSNVFYGNVEDRDLRLSFVVSERIATIIPEEGAVVKKGDLLATLETVRIENEVEEAQTKIRLATSKIDSAKNKMERNAALVKTKAVALQDYDNAKADYEVVLAEKATFETQFKIAKRKLEDAKLFAPANGIVRKRLLEPGEWTSADRPVVQLALTDPKWIRCYMKETELARHKLFERVSVTADSCDKPFKGWLGYISPSAEFMPKNIETDELRPMLVYEARFYVEDPEGILKLGAPVVVHCR